MENDLRRARAVTAARSAKLARIRSLLFGPDVSEGAAAGVGGQTRALAGCRRQHGKILARLSRARFAGDGRSARSSRTARHGASGNRCEGLLRARQLLPD